MCLISDYIFVSCSFRPFSLNHLRFTIEFWINLIDGWSLLRGIKMDWFKQHLWFAIFELLVKFIILLVHYHELFFIKVGLNLGLSLFHRVVFSHESFCKSIFNFVIGNILGLSDIVIGLARLVDLVADMIKLLVQYVWFRIWLGMQMYVLVNVIIKMHDICPTFLFLIIWASNTILWFVNSFSFN